MNGHLSVFSVLSCVCVTAAATVAADDGVGQAQKKLFGDTVRGANQAAGANVSSHDLPLATPFCQKGHGATPVAFLRNAISGASPNL